MVHKAWKQTETNIEISISDSFTNGVARGPGHLGPGPGIIRLAGLHGHIVNAHNETLNLQAVKHCRSSSVIYTY